MQNFGKLGPRSECCIPRPWLSLSHQFPPSHQHGVEWHRGIRGGRQFSAFSITVVAGSADADHFIGDSHMVMQKPRSASVMQMLQVFQPPSDSNPKKQVSCCLPSLSHFRGANPLLSGALHMCSCEWLWPASSSQLKTAPSNHFCPKHKRMDC